VWPLAAPRLVAPIFVMGIGAPEHKFIAERRLRRHFGFIAGTGWQDFVAPVPQIVLLAAAGTTPQATACYPNNS